MKSRESKLDRYAEQLDELEAEKKTLAEMQAWLKAEGCEVSLGRLSAFLASRRQERLHQQLFGLIATGARMNKELDAAFTANPAPDIEQLIRVTKTLISSLQVQGQANPDLLTLANAMQKTVLDYASGKTRAELEERKLGIQERRVVLLEQKAAAFDQAKGVLENKEMTEEQRAARMREVFGIAS